MITNTTTTTAPSKTNLSPQAALEFAKRRAAVKARNTPCTVLLTGNDAGTRSYSITTPAKHRYTVRMWNENGKRFGRCNCQAGSVGNVCYHLVKASDADDQRFPRCLA